MQSGSPIVEENFKQGTTYLLPFEKAHGLGNDFVVVNASHLPENSSKEFEIELTKKICNRNRGVGADGLIIIDQSKNSSEAIRSWRYYNADGSEAEMCGNGIRCAAKYIYEHGLSGEESSFKIETLAGDILVTLLEDQLVQVNMGLVKEIRKSQSLKIDNFQFDYIYVSMGNPHAVGFFSDINKVKSYGPQIEVHNNFPNKTNVEFASIVDKKTIDLIVWERGCGFTQACGTGACATVVAAIEHNYCQKDESITVRLPGGDLIIKLDSVTNDIFMTGPAELICIGYYNI